VLTSQGRSGFVQWSVILLALLLSCVRNTKTKWCILELGGGLTGARCEHLEALWRICLLFLLT